MMTVIQVALEHPVVIAFQNHPWRPAGPPCDQEIQHTRRIRPAIDQITHMNDRCVSVAGALPVFFDPPVNLCQPVEMAMDVADGVEA